MHKGGTLRASGGGGVMSGIEDDVSDLILRSCRERDAGAKISSILRDGHGRTVVRVRASVENNAVQLLKTLKGLWPLAKTAVIENKLDGTIEAQIVVPKHSDEQMYARQHAYSSRCSELLRVAMYVLLVAGVAMYASELHNSFWAGATFHQEL